MEKQLKIFIVDDDIFYLRILEKHIRNLGVEDISAFTNGTDCLNRLSDKPDIIFLDYCMNTLTGYDVLKKIKRHDPNIYTVMISGQEDIKPAVDSLKHGAFDYLQKGNNITERIEIVLNRIIEVRDLSQRSKSSFLKNLFSFL